MLGIRYLKTSATNHVILYRGGQVVRQGAGLSFFYFAPTAVIVQVPVSSVDVPFAFTEATADFQEVTVQGSLTYRVTDPERISGLLDFTIDANGRYQSDDPSKVGERLVQAAQIGARRYVQGERLAAVLVGAVQLIDAMRGELGESAVVQQLGLEVLQVVVTSIKADPEMAKALQAEAREQLLRRADEAIYARRNASVELERTIRENELRTELTVAEKQREVHEAEMAGQIAVEQQRTSLVEAKVANERQESLARAEALKGVLDAAQQVDWRTLLCLLGESRPGTWVAAAFQQLAGNAEKIGQLNISPELLEALTRRGDE